MNRSLYSRLKTHWKWQRTSAFVQSIDNERIRKKLMRDKACVTRGSHSIFQARYRRSTFFFLIFLLLFSRSLITPVTIVAIAASVRFIKGIIKLHWNYNQLTSCLGVYTINCFWVTSDYLTYMNSARTSTRILCFIACFEYLMRLLLCLNETNFILEWFTTLYNELVPIILTIRMLKFLNWM